MTDVFRISSLIVLKETQKKVYVFKKSLKQIDCYSNKLYLKEVSQKQLLMCKNVLSDLFFIFCYPLMIVPSLGFFFDLGFVPDEYLSIPELGIFP